MQINIAAIIHPFEIIIFIIMNAYQYFPGILPDPQMDNYLGSYVSNSLIVPASAVIINAFSLSMGYTLGIAALFTGIDWYFAAIGIYKHFWWKSIYTGIGLSIIYILSKRIWAGLREQQPTLIFRLLVIYLTYAPIYNIIIFLLNRGGHLFRFQLQCAGEPEKIHQGLFYIYLFITSIIVTLCIGLKLRLRYRLLGIIVLVLLNWAIGHYHIFVPQVADVSAHQLILVTIITVPTVSLLFLMAKLNYLFP
ncbi:hypothetical protein [Pelosinus sp. IPA-1]|uniref:hypothetical protein n=1 Tax=Pelosinus sp. IPA-1 TaxID=3029569 RepID=UPI002552389A|nr:hypothetical protein [Pelosinus sp. IPA-1]